MNWELYFHCEDAPNTGKHWTLTCKRNVPCLFEGLRLRGKEVASGS